MTSYHDELKALAESIGSDGCTNSPDTNIECCWEHDWMFTTGTTPRGVAVTRAFANQRYRDCIQARSSLRWLSPPSWLRWLAVRQFGGGIWRRRVQPPVHLARSLVFADTGPALAEARAARARMADEDRLIY